MGRKVRSGYGEKSPLMKVKNLIGVFDWFTPPYNPAYAAHTIP